jgi:hypothetical protein
LNFPTPPNTILESIAERLAIQSADEPVTAQPENEPPANGRPRAWNVVVTPPAGDLEVRCAAYLRAIEPGIKGQGGS